MKKSEYYDTVSRSGFLAFANALGATFGLSVPVEGPAMIFPPELASGRLEFYEVNPGFAIGLADCVFHHDMKISQGAVAGSDHYRILFNVGDEAWQMTNHDGSRIQCGNSLADAVLFSTNSMETTAHIASGQRLKVIVLHYHRSWSVQYLLRSNIPIKVSRLQQFVRHEPMQFSASMDLQSYEYIQQMLQVDAPVRVRVRLLEGYAYQLMALFFNNMVSDKSSDGQRLLSEDAMRIIQLKEKIEQQLEEPLISLEKAAGLCLMSRTKFINMFRAMFQKNYGAFFLELKMEKAKLLLQSGRPIADVGYELGYVNISHFIKSFRLHFGITPGAWQQQNKTPQAGT
jgi:AraC-like DNA-binding protein